MFALPAEKKWQIYCSKKKVKGLFTVHHVKLNISLQTPSADRLRLLTSKNIRAANYVCAPSSLICWYLNLWFHFFPDKIMHKFLVWVRLVKIKGWLIRLMEFMPGFRLPICTEMSQLKSIHSYGISDAPVKLLPNVGFRSRICPEDVKKKIELLPRRDHKTAWSLS